VELNTYITNLAEKH